MRTDVGLPVASIGPSRDETLIVYFDGFIKNVTEGVIRTMIRDEEDWIEKYPDLDSFDNMDQDELYDNTMIFSPEELMASIGKEGLTDEEILKDKYELISNVVLENSKITDFEFALYRLLQEDFVKKCYIYKEDQFDPTEIDYIETQYKDVFDKIELVCGGFLTLYDEAKPTSIFTPDIDLVTKYLPEAYPDEELEDKLFVILNSLWNLTFVESTTGDGPGEFVHTTEFTKTLEELDDKHGMNITTMFNFALDPSQMEEEIDSIIHDEETEDDEEEEDD